MLDIASEITSDQLFRTFSVPHNCVTLKSEQLGLPSSYVRPRGARPRSDSVLNVKVKSHARQLQIPSLAFISTFTKPLYLFPSQSQPCIQFFRASTGSRFGRALSGKMIMYVLTLDLQRFFDCDSSPRYIISMYNPHEDMPSHSEYTDLPLSSSLSPDSKN